MRIYPLTRDLHLYAGLFLSPFVVVFAVSAILLAHRPPQAVAAEPRVVANVDVDRDIENLKGRSQVDALRPVLDRLGVKGEINFVRRVALEHRLVVPVMLPGRTTTVELNVVTRTASIKLEDTGIGGATVDLHKMPGPHNAALRGNSAYIRLWRWLADASAYGTLFLSLTGLYLWTALRAERRTGVMLMALGAVTFVGLVYALAN